MITKEKEITKLSAKSQTITSLFHWQKIKDFSRTLWKIFQDLFGARK